MRALDAGRARQRAARIGRPIVAHALFGLQLVFVLGGAALAASSETRSLDGNRIYVTDVAGQVDVTMAGAGTDVQVDSTIVLPARIVTGDGGSLGLAQALTSITVAADSDIEIPAEAADGQLIARLVQHRGNVFYDVAHRDVGRLRVETPFLVAVIKGTQFNVAVQEDSTTISLFEGRLEIRTPDGSDLLDLSAGEIAIGDGVGPIRIVGMNDDQVRAPRAATPAAGNTALAAREPNAVAAGAAGRVAGTVGAGNTNVLNVATPPNGANLKVDVAGTADPAKGVAGGATATVGAGSANVAVGANANVGAATANVAVGGSVDVGAATARVAVGGNVDVGPATANVAAGTSVDVGAASASVATSTSVDLGAASANVAAGTSVDLGAASANVGVDASADLGTGSADVGLDASADLGTTSADVGLDAGADLGTGSADVGLDTGVDLGTGTVDVGLDAGVDLGTAPADVGLDVGADLGTDSADLSLDTSLDVGSLDLGLDLEVDLGLDLGLDTDTDTSVDTGTDPVTEPEPTLPLPDLGGLLRLP